ncbi:MAG: hypothetical protein WC539_02425 [Nitrospirota bacterium]
MPRVSRGPRSGSVDLDCLVLPEHSDGLGSPALTRRILPERSAERSRG